MRVCAIAKQAGVDPVSPNDLRLTYLTEQERQRLDARTKGRPEVLPAPVMLSVRTKRSDSTPGVNHTSRRRQKRPYHRSSSRTIRQGAVCSSTMTDGIAARFGAVGAVDTILAVPGPLPRAQRATLSREIDVLRANVVEVRLGLRVLNDRVARIVGALTGPWRTPANGTPSPSSNSQSKTHQQLAGNSERRWHLVRPPSVVSRKFLPTRRAPLRGAATRGGGRGTEPPACYRCGQLHARRFAVGSSAQAPRFCVKEFPGHHTSCGTLGPERSPAQGAGGPSRLPVVRIVAPGGHVHAGCRRAGERGTGRVLRLA